MYVREARPSESHPYKAPRFVRQDTKRGQLEADARAALREAGITGPVRYEHMPEPDPPRKTFDDIEGGPEGPWTMPLHRARTSETPRKSRNKYKGKAARKAGKNAKPQKPRTYQKVKVEIEDDAFTCSHPGWDGTECRHIRDVKAMLGIDATPYSTARRRKSTLWLFDDGPSEETRRKNAKRELVVRVPNLAAQYIDREVIEIRRVGRTGLSAKAVCYALAMKVFWNVGYLTLIARLMQDRNFLHFARNWAIAEKAPTYQTFCNRFGKAPRDGEPPLSDYVHALIGASAKPGGELDRTITVDSDQLPTMMCANSRDRKFGPPAPSWRAHRPMIKRHFGVGDVTGLVGAVNVTLDEGLGSGDGPHMPSVAERTKAALKAAKHLAGDKAYSQRRNFTEAERIGLDLYVREKANEKRLEARDPWPEMAQRMARMERTDKEAFKEVYRFRSKGEGNPSSTKRRNGFGRLQARKNDPIPRFPSDLKFNDDDTIDEAISGLAEDLIKAILDAAEAAVGIARLNEALMTMFISNLVHLVTLENLFNERVDFNDPDYAFRGVRLVSEGKLAVKVKPQESRPLDNLE